MGMEFGLCPSGQCALADKVSSTVTPETQIRLDEGGERQNLCGNSFTYRARNNVLLKFLFRWEWLIAHSIVLINGECLETELTELWAFCRRLSQTEIKP